MPIDVAAPASSIVSKCKPSRLEPDGTRFVKAGKFPGLGLGGMCPVSISGKDWIDEEIIALLFIRVALFCGVDSGRRQSC
jgi:hypothetical protein